METMILFWGDILCRQKNKSKRIAIITATFDNFTASLLSPVNYMHNTK